MVSLSEFSRGFSPSSNLESFFGVKNAFFSGSSSSDAESEPTVPSASLVLLIVDLEVWLLDRMQKNYPHGGVWARKGKKIFFSSTRTFDCLVLIQFSSLV